MRVLTAPEIMRQNLLRRAARRRGILLAKSGARTPRDHNLAIDALVVDDVTGALAPVKPVAGYGYHDNVELLQQRDLI
jgi:hypothetical protein